MNNADSDITFDVEGGARRTVEEARISELEFCENLPRIGRLGMDYGFDSLREVLVNMTSAGIPFSRVLLLLERGDVPRNMLVESEA